MSRIIKFRGRKESSGDWVYGTGVFEDGHNTWIFCNKPNTAIAFGIEHIIVDPDTIGQFTGLQDCEGKDIFEGDIVKACDGSFNGKKMFSPPGEVKIINGCVNLPQWVREADWDGTHYVEVIGNIHANPELLEQS